MKENREKRIYIRLRNSEYDTLKREADALDVTVSQFVRRVVAEHIKPLAPFVSTSNVKEGTKKKDTK